MPSQRQPLHTPSSFGHPTISLLDLAFLDGVYEGDFEPGPETLQYHLKTLNDEQIVLDFDAFVRLLRLASDSGFIRPLPTQWWNMVAVLYGESF